MLLLYRIERGFDSAWIGLLFGARSILALAWADVDWLRSVWDGPIILKGIQTVDDAVLAASAGVDAIALSNHGGRQLDGALSSARALPAVADAVAGRIAVLADGGVRSGLDVVRMLALGADFVLMGRGWAYALAARGGPGVVHVLQLIEAEMRVAMALTASMARTTNPRAARRFICRLPARSATP